MHPYADGNGRASRADLHRARQAGAGDWGSPAHSLVLPAHPREYIAGLNAYWYPRPVRRPSAAQKPGSGCSCLRPGTR
ncbi:hypothetical protein ACFRCG_12890 [Embleya sp. NPDC056575]|uniref:hypothetical protein n=1 Tax=unclassified Embleya TaxID=2699296 RepID=UPI0036738F7C